MAEMGTIGVERDADNYLVKIPEGFSGTIADLCQMIEKQAA